MTWSSVKTSAVIEIYRANPDNELQRPFHALDECLAKITSPPGQHAGVGLPGRFVVSIFAVSHQQRPHHHRCSTSIILPKKLSGRWLSTIGLFTAVPITTFIACWIVDDDDRRLVKW